VNVRVETPADHGAIRALVARAMGPAEAELVEQIRASDGYRADLALVADDGGAVVGHVLFSAVTLLGSEAREVLALAPLCVTPERQRQGIGTALVETGLTLADRSGAPLVVVLGHPAYYRRFGFEPARHHGILPHRDDVPDDVFMVRRLSAYASELTGRVVYPPAFGSIV